MAHAEVLQARANVGKPFARVRPKVLVRHLKMLEEKKIKRGGERGVRGVGGGGQWSRSRWSTCKTKW